MRRNVKLFVLCVLSIPSIAHADDWPQWLGPQRDGIWRETGIVEKLPVGGPKVRWRTPIGAGYSGPAVANDRVFITDYLLNQGSKQPDSPFDAAIVPGKERVLCLDEATGKIIWQHAYDCDYEVSYAAGPRTTPVVSGGKVYTLGTMGNLLCLDENKGKVLWSKNVLKEYQADIPFWGYSAHLLLDGDRLISLVGGTGSAVVAFHKDTGKEIWRALTAPEIGYAPPILVEAGKTRQLIVWHPASVNGLDPATGKVFWSVPWGDSPSKKKGKSLRAGMSIPTPRLAGDRLLLSCFYDGSLLLKLNTMKPAAEVLWQQKGRSEAAEDTVALHCVMSTPFIKDGHVYGVCSYGDMRCIKLETGERLWSSLAATGGISMRWGNAFIIPQGNRYFLFNEKGDLIIARMSPAGYEEISRATIMEATNTMPGRRVLWSHPAFANRSMYARNDREIVCVSLAETK